VRATKPHRRLPRGTHVRRHARGRRSGALGSCGAARRVAAAAGVGGHSVSPYSLCGGCARRLALPLLGGVRVCGGRVARRSRPAASPPARGAARRRRDIAPPRTLAAGVVLRLATLFSLDAFAGVRRAVAARASGSNRRFQLSVRDRGSDLLRPRHGRRALAAPLLEARRAHRARADDGLHAPPGRPLLVVAGVGAERAGSRSPSCCSAPRCRRWTCRRPGVR